MEKKCEGCKNRYVAKHSKQKYCSIECQHIAQHKREVRRCVGCGKSFNIIPSSFKKYCSHVCFLKSPKNIKRLLQIIPKTPWNKDRKTGFTDKQMVAAKQAGIKRRGQKRTAETRENISNALKGRKLSSEHCLKIREAAMGRKASVESRIKRSISERGENGSNWQGGKTDINQVIRQGVELRLWRESVFARDNWTCQDCGKRGGGELNAHHIKPFSKYPELRTSIENGITLCRKCHKLRHKL